MVNGFSNRFLWCFVTSIKRLPDGGDHSVLDGYGERLRMAIEKARTIDRVTRSEEARQLWHIVYSQLRRERKGAYGTATSRAAPQVVRLSLIYALIDGSSIIEIEHLRAALAVWSYCDESAEMFFGGSTPLNKFEKRILDFIVANDGCSKNDIRKAKASHKNAEEFDAVLSDLIKRNKIVKREELNGHIKTIRFYECNENNATITTIATKQSANPMNHVGELLDWRNANGIEFVKTDEGKVWVSYQQEHLLNDQLRNTITTNQSVVSSFVSTTTTETTTEAETATEEAEAEAEEEMSEAEFYAEMNKIAASVNAN